MGFKRIIYTKDSYNGVVIMNDARRAKGKVTSFYKSMLDGLFKLGYYARDGSGYKKPVGLMITFAFTESCRDYPIGSVMTRIWNSYSKSRLPKRDNQGKVVRQGRKPENTFKIEYLWARETKLIDATCPEFHDSLTSHEKLQHRLSDLDACPIPYEHYHLVIVLDDKKGCWTAIKTVMDGLVDAGIVRPGFHFSENNMTKEKVLNLRDEAEFNEFIYRNSYVCKSDTKEISDRRFWGMSLCRKRVSKPTRK